MNDDSDYQAVAIDRLLWELTQFCADPDFIIIPPQLAHEFAERRILNRRMFQMDGGD